MRNGNKARLRPYCAARFLCRQPSNQPYSPTLSRPAEEQSKLRVYVCGIRNNTRARLCLAERVSHVIDKAIICGANNNLISRACCALGSLPSVLGARRFTLGASTNQPSRNPNSHISPTPGCGKLHELLKGAPLCWRGSNDASGNWSHNLLFSPSRLNKLTSHPH
jgi:hypothetical protein